MNNRDIEFFDIGCYYLWRYNFELGVVWYTSGDNKICFSKKRIDLYLQNKNLTFEIDFVPTEQDLCITKFKLAEIIEPDSDPNDTIMKYDL